MVQPTANTELTIAFIRILESIMCLLCLITHIHSLEDEEPMPHIVLFCGTFGGFFILSLAKLVVPLSGQLSPPGVDLVFSFLGFILFYAAACAAMYFVQRDPHLIAKDGLPPIVDEETHPFFQRSVNHAILSISTGTLFLMHAVISADRLTSILKGIEEDVEREIDINDIDIFPEDTISLHLFFINWLILIWNTACCRSIRKLFRRCQLSCIRYYRRKRPPSYIPRRRQHRRAKMLMTTELTRINGISVSNIAPQEFIRNPRRSLALNSLQAFVENENTIKKTIFVDTAETPQQGPSSQPQDKPRKKAKTVVWNVKENSETDMPLDNNESGEGQIIPPDRIQTRNISRETASSNNIQQDRKSTASDNSSDSFHSDEMPFDASFTRNKEFGSDEDLPKKLKKAKKAAQPPKQDPSEVSMLNRGISFMRNEAFEDDEETPKISKIEKIKNILKKKPPTADNTEDPDEFSTSPKRSISFIRNKAFGSDAGSMMIPNKESMDIARRNERQVSFTRNKEFGSEGETKLKKLFKWIPRKAESVVQNVSKETIRAMETFSPKFTMELPATEIVVDSRANSEVEISSFGFGGKSMDMDNKERKTSPAHLQIPTRNEEALGSTIYEANADAANSYLNVISDSEFHLYGKMPKTSLQNQNVENKEIVTDLTRNMASENLALSESIRSSIQKPKIFNNKESTMTVAENAELPNLPTANVIPYLLTSKINRELETNLDNEFEKTQQGFDSTSSLEEVTDLTSNKMAESTLEIQTTDDKYRYIFPALDSASYMKEVASLIPSSKISERTSKSETDETEYRSIFPALDSTSYMKENASLISSINISESTPKNETTQHEYQTVFPELDSSSYLQTVVSLIPSSINTDNPTPSRKAEKKKKLRDDIKKEK